LFSHNPIDFIPIVLHDVASFNNVVGFCNISNAFGSQQPTINVQVFNLSDSLSIKSSPLDSPPKLFGIDA
jgi:hypothetical protein